jgi:hypothetical protein
LRQLSLRSLDYRNTRDRPKESEKALGSVVAISVSTRYVRRVLSGQDKENKENRNSVPIFSKVRTLRKIEALIGRAFDFAKARAAYERRSSASQGGSGILSEVESQP